MVRDRILLGLLIAMCLPAFIIKAREVTSRPVILAVSLDGDIAGFVPFLKEIVEPSFEVKSRSSKNVMRGDLIGAIYILFYGWLNKNELKKFPGTLSEDFKRFNNKGLVLFGQPGFPSQEVDPELKKLFKDQIFNLHMRFGKNGIELVQNENSEQFKRLFSEMVQTIARRVGVINPQVMQRLEQFGRHLQQRSDLQQLNQEFSEIMRQLNGQ